MENYDFNMYDKNSIVLENGYVILQAGRGKKENSSVKVDSKSFSYVEGLIWDKYREYGERAKTKIPSGEWERILIGFSKAVAKLDLYVESDKLEDILKFSIIDSQEPLEDILNQVADLSGLITNITTWITDQTSKESSIYIIKK